MKISLAQINPTVGDLNYNYKLIVKHAIIAEKNEAEVLITPELSICGYPPEDLLLNDEFIEKCNYFINKIAIKFPRLKIIIGHPRKYKGLLFNSASLLFKGKIQKTYDKKILPNYGVFDEKRYFNSGQKSVTFNHKGKKFGLLICEDIWTPGPAEELSKKNVDYIICINASPYEINKAEMRVHEIQKRISRLGAIQLIYVNMVGGQDELLFDGLSFITHPNIDESNRNVYFSSRQFLTLNATLDLTLDLGKSVIEKYDKFPFHRAPSSSHLYLAGNGPKQCLIYNLLNGLILATKDYIEKNSIKNILIGLSGGIDSAVVLFIASKAIKKENITAIMMPSAFTSKDSLEDAKALAKNLGVTYKVTTIEPLMKSFNKSLAKDFKGLKKDITEENIQARIRGVLLMAYGNKFNGMVLATGNKSEVAVGYSTIYGDMVGGFSVLKDVPKTLVYKIANEINYNQIIIPNRIITRPPSAELSENQTDQDSLPNYDVLDGIIDLYIDKNYSAKMIIKKGFSAQVVKKVVRLIENNEFKRRQSAPGPKVTHKAFGKDRRYPITSKYKP